MKKFLLFLIMLLFAATGAWAQWTPSTVCSYSVAYSVPPTGPRDNRGIALSPDGMDIYLGYNNGPEFRYAELSSGTYLGGNNTDRGKCIATDDQGRVYTTGFEGNPINIYDGDLTTLLYTIPMAKCEGITVTREAGNLYLYATERNLGTLSRFLLTESGASIIGYSLDGLDGDGVVTITGGNGIRGVAVDTDGTIYVTNPGSATLFKMNADGSGITGYTYTGQAENPYYIAIIGTQLFVTQGNYAAPDSRVAVIKFD